ncbi:MAG: hypothetical protein JWR32_4808 [Mycobacterium sp.]|nr:hypothetical protein [Mycobacterium sp.]
MADTHRNEVHLRLFDIRNIVGALLGIYGVLLIIAGLVPGVLRTHDNKAAASDRVDLYAGTSANWWVGLVLVAVAAVFFTWAMLRPLRVDVHALEQESPSETEH